MSYVFHRSARRDPPLAVSGSGPYLTDAAGRRYLDGCGGAAVSCLGHGHPAVIAAIKKQAETLAYAHSGFFSSEPAEALAEHLIRRAPQIDGAPTLARAYFVSGGSEAVEACLKLARQYFIETGRPQRRHLIARRQSYHGNTLGALSVGGNAWRREPFAPLLSEAHHIAPCYPYRERRDGETAADYALRAADELEAKILELGPDTVCAFVAEPVVGATLGAVPALPGYLRRVREICDRYGVLLVLDEVMCGMGRTGFLYACEEDGVVPDLMAIAKGLGAGYQPIGAMLTSAAIFDAVRDGSGFFQHGHTYLAHPTACAAALAVQHTVDAEGLLERVLELGRYLAARLEDRFGDHPNVGDIRGRGLFRGLEFVADRADKTPFDPALALNAKLKQNAMARGLMCYPMGGTVDGRRGDHVLLAPPFIVDQTHLDELTDKLDAALTDTLAEAPVAA